MFHRSGLVLTVAALALLGGVAWIAFSSTESPTAAADASRAAETQTSSSRTAAIDAADAPSTAPNTAANELDAVAATDVARAEVADRPPFDVTDAIWVGGRVIFPTGTPADERAEVVASFGDDDSKKPHRALVAADGTFRAAFPAGTATGEIDLRARYAFLRAPIELVLSEPVKDLVLEPELGGCVHATLVLPAASEVRRRELIGTKMYATGVGVLRSNADSSHTTRTAEITDSTHVDIGGLVPGIAHGISGNPKTFAPIKFQGVRVQPGSVTAITVSVADGVALRGRVVDESAQAIAGATFRVASADGNKSAYGTRDTPSAADGRFALEGVAAGQITLTVACRGYLATPIRLEPIADGGARDDLDVVLKRGRSLRGRVQWADGRAAAGIKLSISLATSFSSGDQWQELGWWEPQEHATAPDGSFEIAGLTAGPFALVALAQPAADATVAGSARIDAVASGSEPIVLTLEPGHELAGRVVDDVGHGVGRFTVIATPASTNPDRDDVSDAVNGRLLGKEGRFVVEGLRAGDWRITVKGGGGRVRREVSVPRDSAALEILLPRPASISGVVRDPTGAPVRGARVTFDSNTTPGAPAGMQVFSKPTGADGRFEARDVPSGPITVRASLLGWAPSDDYILDLTPGQVVTDVVSMLRLGGRLTGEVLDAAGRADGERQVYAYFMRGGSSTTASAVCDAAGQFEFDGLPAGSYTVQTMASAAERDAARDADGKIDWQVLQSTTKRARVDIVAGQTAHVVLGEAPRAPVRVRGLVSSRGRPVAGVTVSAYGAATKSGSPLSSRTGDDGRYELGLDGPGQYTFMVRDGARGRSGASCHRIETIPDASDVTVDMELASARIAGRVVTPDGKPAQGLQVELHAEQPGASSAGVMRTDAGWSTTGEDGLFAFEHLQPGTYTVNASEMRMWGADQALRFGRTSVRGLVVAEDAAIENVELKLALAGRLEVEVRGPAGEPISGANVFTFDESGAVIEDYSGSSSDAAGRKRIGGLAPQRVFVVAHKGSLASAVSAPIQVRASEMETLTVVLKRATVLDVVVRGPDGQPMPASITVRDERGIDFSDFAAMSRAGGAKWPASAPVSAVGPLPPGRYRVSLDDEAHTGVDVDITGADRQTVELALPKPK